MDVAGFRVRYPEFTEALVGDDIVQMYLNDAALFVGERFEERAEIGTGYYVAHHCAVYLNNQAQNPALLASGDIVSRSGGHGLSFSRAAGAVQEQQSEPMLRTTYGQQFVALRDLVGSGAVAGGQSFGTGLGLDQPDAFTSRTG